MTRAAKSNEHTPCPHWPDKHCLAPTRSPHVLGDRAVAIGGLWWRQRRRHQPRNRSRLDGFAVTRGLAEANTLACPNGFTFAVACSIAVSFTVAVAVALAVAVTQADACAVAVTEPIAVPIAVPGRM